jgi:Tfp pilus assembly protein PilN
MKLDLIEIKKRLRARSALAITIESGRLAVKLVRSDANDMQPESSFSIPLGDEEVLKDPEKAGHQLVAALGAAGIRERQCVVCVPPGWALTASTDLPEVGDEDLRGYLELRAEREFSISATDLRLGYSAYALPNGQRRATLAALASKKIEAVERMLEIAGRRASSISLALDHCLSQPQAMLHFLTNGNHTDVVVTAGGGIAGLRSFAGPLTSGGAAFDTVGFCRDVRITLGRLPEPVRQQIRHAAFCGPSAEKLCVETRYDLLRLGIKSPECHSAAATDQPSLEAASAGEEAARRKLRGQPIAFEFVVPETKRWQELLQRVDSSRRRGLLLAAVGVVLLPLLLLFVRSQIESHLQARWDAMAGNVADLDAIQQKIHLYRPWFEPAPQGLQLLDSLIQAFPDQGDVWAKSIQVAEGGKVTCTGFARSQPALMALLARMRARPDITALQVQQIRGANPIEFSITYQWEFQHD